MNNCLNLFEIPKIEGKPLTDLFPNGAVVLIRNKKHKVTGALVNPNTGEIEISCETLN